MKNLEMIVCVAKDNLIGDKNPKGNGLLWHVPEELAYFKEKSMGKSLIFGKNTANCIPINLMKKTREVIVLDDGANVDEILKKLEKENKTILICGGYSVYKYFLDNYNISKIYCSELKDNVNIENATEPLYLPKLEEYNYTKKLIKEYENFTAYLYEKQ